jgi:hypothetical protein
VEQQWGKSFLQVSILKKIFLSRSSRPISVKFVTNHLCIKGIEVCTVLIKGQVIFKGEIISKIGWFIFLKNHKARKTQIYIKASWYSAK